MITYMYFIISLCSSKFLNYFSEIQIKGVNHAFKNTNIKGLGWLNEKMLAVHA